MGWQMARQKFQWLVPYHSGAIAYFKSQGLWTQSMQNHQDGLLRRQAVLAKAWSTFIAAQGDAALDRADWDSAWMAQRAKYLTAAGFDPIWSSQ
jgi:hypothetical protein